MTKFSTCLNQELKVYGISLLAIIMAMGFFVFGAILFSMLVAIAFAGVGFVIGIWISKNWHLGKIQRFAYWHLGILVKTVPSHKRYFF